MPHISHGKTRSTGSRGYSASPGAELMRQRIAELESQLAEQKNHMQTLIRDYEACIEELQTTREEVHAANEELLFATGQLMAEREELRHNLEHSDTEKDNLTRRLNESSLTGEDLACILDILDTPVLQLSADLALRYYTTAAAKVWNLEPADRGRHISDLASSLHLPQIASLCSEALGDLVSRKIPVCDSVGRPAMLVVRPFAGRRNRAVRIAVMLVPQDYDIPVQRDAVVLQDLLNCALPRIRAALGDKSPVELIQAPEPLKVLVNPAMLESVLVRSALAVQQTVVDPAHIAIESFSIDAFDRASASRLEVPIGSYSAISILATPSEPIRSERSPRIRSMQVPEFSIRELGAHYRVEYSPGIDSRLTLYLPRPTE